MTAKNPRQKVLDMIAAGQITPEEGEKLLASMDTEKKASVWTWLFNPLEALGTGGAVAVALVISGASALLGKLADVRFDGVFDIHVPLEIPLGELAGQFGQETIGAASEVTWLVAVADQLVSWPLFAVVAWLLSLAFVRQGRLVDFIAATGVARVPLFFAAVVTRSLFPVLVGEARSLADAALELAVIGLATIPLVIWFAVAAYRGFKTASGAAGWKVIVSFIIAAIASETIGKILLYVFV